MERGGGRAGEREKLTTSSIAVNMPQSVASVPSGLCWLLQPVLPPQHAESAYLTPHSQSTSAGTRHSTVTSQSRDSHGHSHRTVIAQSQHSRSTVAAQAQSQHAESAYICSYDAGTSHGPCTSLNAK